MNFFLKILFVLASVFFLSCTVNTPLKKSLSSVNCAKDEDCVLVNTACCGCTNKTGATAVHKSLVSEYVKKRRQKCSVACTLEMTYCELKAVCAGSKCTTTDGPKVLSHFIK